MSAAERIVAGLGQAIDHARSLDVTIPAPAPWDYMAVSANASGGFHVYLIDANQRKIAAVWGGAGEKLETASLMRAAPELYALLAVLEWGDDERPGCPFCGMGRESGHLERCQLADALAKAISGYDGPLDFSVRGGDQ